MRPTSFAVRLALFYGAIFTLIGVFLPYFPVWLNARGLSAGEIGIVLAAPLFVRVLVTPGISFAADKSGNRRLMLIALAWSAFLAGLLFFAASSFLTILLVVVLFALFWTSVMPLTEAVAMQGVRRSGLDYGRMRLWGSLSFIAASIGGGLAIQNWGSQAALWIFIGATASVAVMSFALPQPTGKGWLRAAAPVPEIRLADALRLARNPLFLALLFATALVQGSHAVYYGFATLHWRSVGIPMTDIGQLWATGVVAEIALFAVSRRVVAAYGPVRLIMFAGFASVLRWPLLTLDPPLEVLFPLQLLHAFTFGAAHLGALYFIAAAVPDQYSATAQGLYASVAVGIALGLGVAIAGPLYNSLGAEAYWAMGLLGALSILGSWWLMVHWDGKHLPMTTPSSRHSAP